MGTWNIEVTDTFGGEANYSWVRRYTVELPEGSPRAAIKRAAKRVAGMTGERGAWDDYGDRYTFHPRGACVVMFVSYREAA
jgi:hypothetical protein